MTKLGESIKIYHFRSRRRGPEARMEDRLLPRLPSIFPREEHRAWTVGSPPLGAGIPDIVIVSFRPEIFALSHVEMPKTQLLAYLRAIPRARVETIADKLKQPVEVLVKCLDDLVEVEIVIEDGGTYKLSECWKDILPEIAAIEVKVADWKRAVNQAARNRIFAHQSFIAVPNQTALRIRGEPLFRMLGIGILGVTHTGDVSIVRRARRFQPRVWDYYYKLAEITARFKVGKSNAFHRSHR